MGFVKRLLDKSNAKWKKIVAHFYRTKDVKLYFKSNQAMNKKIHSKFYLDAHNSWSELQTLDNPTHVVIQNQIFWNNQYITIQIKPFERPTWLNNGIFYVNDILNQNDFLYYNEINNKFGVRCHFLQALQIRQSLSLASRCAIRTEYSYKPLDEPLL